MFRTFTVTLICTTLFTPLLLGSLGSLAAQVMSSGSFQIDSDSINVSGGFTSSDNYQLESTMGEIASGDSDSENFELRAGFQQMQSVQISMSAPDPVVMDRTIPGVAGGLAYGSTTVTVVTDSPSGYQIQISASDNPALQANATADTIADYVPVGDTDYNFVIGDSDAHMGYTVVSAHALSRFFNNETVCDTGSFNTGEHCWAGLSTTPSTIVSHGQSNHPTGTDTTIYFQVGVGGSVLQPPGVYTATTTLTAMPL